jgi:hypothetical protein
MYATTRCCPGWLWTTAACSRTAGGQTGRRLRRVELAYLVRRSLPGGSSQPRLPGPNICSRMADVVGDVPENRNGPLVRLSGTAVVADAAVLRSHSPLGDGDGERRTAADTQPAGGPTIRPGPPPRSGPRIARRRNSRPSTTAGPPRAARRAPRPNRVRTRTPRRSSRSPVDQAVDTSSLASVDRQDMTPTETAPAADGLHQGQVDRAARGLRP